MTQRSLITITLFNSLLLIDGAYWCFQFFCILSALSALGPGMPVTTPHPVWLLIDFRCTKAVYSELLAPAKITAGMKACLTPQFLYIVQSESPCVPDVLTILTPPRNIILTASL